MEKKVFIVNHSCHDLSAAEAYGEIVIMTKGYFNQLATGKMYRSFSESLAKSNPKDYIVPCGHRIMSDVACAMFASIHKRLNLLIWIPTKNNREDELIPGRYKERIIFMEGLDELQRESSKISNKKGSFN